MQKVLTEKHAVAKIAKLEAQEKKEKEVEITSKVAKDALAKQQEAVNKATEIVSPQTQVKQELEMLVEKHKAATTDEILEYGKTLG